MTSCINAYSLEKNMDGIAATLVTSSIHHTGKCKALEVITTNWCWPNSEPELA